MVQFVRDHGIFGPEHRLEQTPIGVKTAAVEDGVVGSEEL